MSIAEVLEMSDVDTIPVMEVGSVVVPLDTTDNPLVTPKMYKDFGIQKTYGFAIVVSMAPFILVSENARMRWENTLAEVPAVMAADGVTVITPVIPAAITKLKAIGKATNDIMLIVNTRLGA